MKDKSVMYCEWCRVEVPHIPDESDPGVSEPAYEWHGNGFCADCYEEILKKNPHVVYPDNDLGIPDKKSILSKIMKNLGMEVLWIRSNG